MILCFQQSIATVMHKFYNLFLSYPQLMNLTLCLSCGNSLLWWPSGRCEKLISMDEQNIFLWNLDCSKKSAEVIQLRGYIDKLVFLCAFCLYLGVFAFKQVISKDSAGMLHSLSGGAWSPHDVNAVAATGESSVQFWDLRTMKYGITVDLLYSDEH